MFGPIDDLFDLNHDGKMDWAEEAFEFDVLSQQMREIRRDPDSGWADDTDFDDDDDEI